MIRCSKRLTSTSTLKKSSKITSKTQSRAPFRVGMIQVAKVKSSIEGFLDLLRRVKSKIGLQGEPTPALLMAPEIKSFTELSDEDKRRVFEEFKDKI